MTILMLMVIMLSTITTVVNVRTSRVVAQLGSTPWVQVDPISFKYDEFSTKDDVVNTLTFANNATIDNDTRALQLTSPSSKVEKANNHLSQVIYSKSIQFKGINPKTKKVSVASFSTFFSFSLPPSFTHQNGGQFIFFLMANPINLTANGSISYPSALILNNGKPPMNVIAIEYDMCLDEEFNDNNNNDIEANMDSGLYLARINPLMSGVSWSDGKLIYSWVDYHDSSKELEVRNSNDDNKPYHPIFQVSIDSTSLYSDLMYVGFRSQPQFNNVNKILIHTWSFETHYQPWHPNEVAPTPSPSPSELGNYNKSIEAKDVQLGKILGTIIGVAFLIMLICAILVGFSHFGFSCIANPEELIDLEFSTLEEYSKGKVEEGIESKLNSCTKTEEPQTSETNLRKEEVMEESNKKDFQLTNEENYLFRRGSLWGDSLDHHAGLKEDTLKVTTKTQTSIHEGRRSLKSSIFSVAFGPRRASTSVEEPQDIPTSNLCTNNEKEQIANLIKEATQKEEEVEATQYQYKELSEATKSFGSSNKLGGNLSESHATYKGYLPISSTEIVVKVLSIELLKTKSKDIRTEMSALSRLQHPNLVKLLGWCKHQGKFYIVYELALGQSLDKIIFKNDSILIDYPWEKRFATIKAIASALHYLHEGWQLPIIHRNVKSNNVMIDIDQTNCKLGDYGLGCLINMNQIEPPKASSLFFQDATYGYLAPEFAKTKVGTIYTDVYSFGILCLEVVCRRQLEDHKKEPEEQLLVEWLLHLEEEDKLIEAIEDKALLESEIQQILLVLSLSLMCVGLLPKGRPTMKQVVKCLSGEIPLPLIPISETMDTLASTPRAASISTPTKHIINKDNDSAPTMKDPISFSNILFETKNEWTNDIFFVGGKAYSSKLLNKTRNSWIDIHDNFLFVSNERKPFLPPSQANNSWVDIATISLNEMVGILHQSCKDLETQQIQENNSWVEIPGVNLTANLVTESLQPKKLTHLEWMENLEVFNSTWTHVGSTRSREPNAPLQDFPFEVISSNVSTTPKLDFFIGEPMQLVSHAPPVASTQVPCDNHPQKKSKKRSPKFVRPFPSLNLLSVEKTHPIRSGSNLPPPIWPLPIPNIKLETKSRKKVPTLNVTHPHSLPLSKGKGTWEDTQMVLVSPSSNSETSTIDLKEVSRKLKYLKETFLHSSPNHGSKSSLPSTPPKVDLEALSSKLKYLKESFLQKNSPSHPYQPPNHGSRISLSPSPHISDHFDSSASTTNIGSGSQRTSRSSHRKKKW